ncbi:DGQHR domain-containing protein [Cloacibacillus porcorum]|uniref:DGQHR domain-containing protein n=2 Tax=Cloacibacillus porcorum TaxID=1197717 RepID=UPI0014593BFB|nr:DGQHR domain-containing protein [Cloacibacillus porcorum]MDY5391152.1 DGQHR domain-containing protein [Cloacibacillus porcorum]NMF19264.1 DGQHR domain-containing protein [Cloacibacillus porcorum]
MKKVYLEKIQQRNTIFYTGKYDAKKLSKMADDIEVGETQEAQRPLEKRHLQEIAEYVANAKSEGLLPGSVMLATKKERLKIQNETVTIERKDEHTKKTVTLYYIEMPDSIHELEQYKGSIEIIDGQHRLFAFRDEYRSPDFKDDIVYELTFSVFEYPDLHTRRMLFMVTNEKQKAVSGNLLLYLREKLHLLSSDEKEYYPLIGLLNTEEQSPLKGRIIMGAERIVKGYKAKELIKILKKSMPETINAGGNPLDDRGKLKVLSIYLEGWEIYYHLSFRKPGKDTMTKISGLRYILLLFCVFWQHALEARKQFNQEYIRFVIKELHCLLGLTEEQSVFDESNNFRGESATIKLAERTGESLKNHLTNLTNKNFNPLA